MMSEERETQLVLAADAGDLTHRVARPAGPGPHPTVLMLHGRSGDENVMWVFARALPAEWLIVAPRAIQPDPAGGFAWHPRKPDEWPPLSFFSEAASAIVRFVHSLPERYEADVTRLFVMGFSQGAAAAFAVALRHPGLVHGIAALVGFMPGGVADELSAPLAGLPVFMAVGRRDPVIPLTQAHACATILRTLGAELAYHEYDSGHKLDARGMRDLQAWWRERAGS